jgi:uncharacterized membrane protein
MLILTLAHGRLDVIDMFFSPFSLAFLAVAVVAVITNLVLVATRYSNLPEEVPTHYGFFGRPDRWGSKAIMWFFALMPVMTVILLAAPITGMVARTTKNSDIDEVRATIRLLAAMSAYLSVGSYVMTLRMIAVAEKESDGLGRMTAPLFLGGLTLVTVLFLLPLLHK